MKSPVLRNGLSGLTVLLFSLAFTCLPGLSAGNQPDEASATLRKRPTVGLVLSGGGAKGFAYIGLLKVIREAGLPIDYIGGSSIGSIMGGLYAIGYSPDTIAKLIRSQNWDDLLKDNMPRKYVAYEEKGIHEKTIITLPVRNKKIGIGSMYQGQEVSLLLNNYFSPAYKTTDFTKLPIPFLCIGTDLLTGQEVVMKKGYLPGAIRASMSIPGYFEPVDYMGYYLVDGGVVNNYPVKEVKEMGAQIILGGDVQSGLYKTKAELQSITAILDQITSFARIDANEIGDSLTNLKVRIKMSYGMMDFDQYDSIIALGERVARSHFREIKALADSLNAIEYRPVNHCTASPLKKIHVDSLAIRDNVKMSDKYFLSIFGNYKGRDVSMEELERDIRMTYGSGYFQKVTYELDYSGEKTTLVIHALEGGPGAFSAGIHYDTDYGICLLLGGAFRNVLGRNSKLFAELNIAVNPRLKVTYFYGFGGHGSMGANAEGYSFKVNVYDKDMKTNALNLTNYTIAPFFNYNFRNMVSLRTGFQYEYFRFRQDYNLDSLAQSIEQFSSYGNLFLSLNADTRDKPWYPTRGIKAGFRIEYIMPFSKNWSSQLFTNTLLFSLKFNQNIPLSRRFVLQPGLFAAALFKSDYTPPVQHTFGLGGLMTENYIESFVPFTGLYFIQKFGYYSLVGRMKLQYNVFDEIYAIFRADAGANEFVADELFDQKNFLFGYGLTAGYNSFIGPLEVSIMGSNLNPGPTFFLSLGFPF